MSIVTKCTRSLLTVGCWKLQAGRMAHEAAKGDKVVEIKEVRNLVKTKFRFESFIVMLKYKFTFATEQCCQKTTKYRVLRMPSSIGFRFFFSIVSIDDFKNLLPLFVKSTLRYKKFWKLIWCIFKKTSNNFQMRRFMVDCMTTAGACESHAAQLADVLVEGDKRGHYSHGLNRLG